MLTFPKFIICYLQSWAACRALLETRGEGKYQYIPTQMKSIASSHHHLIIAVQFKHHWITTNSIFLFFSFACIWQPIHCSCCLRQVTGCPWWFLQWADGTQHHPSSPPWDSGLDHRLTILPPHPFYLNKYFNLLFYFIRLSHGKYHLWLQEQSGRYHCIPTNTPQASVLVHVLDGEDPHKPFYVDNCF